jgi:hypothetical protein
VHQRVSTSDHVLQEGSSQRQFPFSGLDLGYLASKDVLPAGPVSVQQRPDCWDGQAGLAAAHDDAGTGDLLLAVRPVAVDPPLGLQQAFVLPVPQYVRVDPEQRRELADVHPVTLSRPCPQVDLKV